MYPFYSAAVHLLAQNKAIITAHVSTNVVNK